MEAGKSKVKTPVSSEGLFPGLQMVVFLLCPHMAEQNLDTLQVSSRMSLSLGLSDVSVWLDSGYTFWAGNYKVMYPSQCITPAGTVSPYWWSSFWSLGYLWYTRTSVFILFTSRYIRNHELTLSSWFQFSSAPQLGVILVFLLSVFVIPFSNRKKLDSQYPQYILLLRLRWCLPGFCTVKLLFFTL